MKPLFTLLTLLLLISGAPINMHAQLQHTMEANMEQPVDCDPISKSTIREQIDAVDIHKETQITELELVVLKSIKDNCSLEELKHFSKQEQETFVGHFVEKLFNGAPPMWVTQKEKNIHQILTGSPDDVLMFQIGEDGFITDSSPSAAKALCYTEQQIQSVHFMCMIHPNDVVRSVREFMIRRTSESIDNPNFTNRYWTGCGDYVSLRWTGRFEKYGQTFAIAEVVGREK